MNKKHTNLHHRKPRSHGGNSKPSNLSEVNRDKHEAWHLLFKNYHPDLIAIIINDVWLDPQWEFVCQPRIKK